MAPKLTITHIGTATSILTINGINFLTDPFFSPAESSFPLFGDFSLRVEDDPALGLEQLPIIDAVLLSHEDHVDNLDDYGRQLLNGRLVLTTVDGARNLAPRPGVRGLKPWEKVSVKIAGNDFQIIGTPTQHVKGQECTGFIITNEDFGTGRDGLPNAIWFSGDTVYLPEFRKIAEEYHICAAIFNLGNAHAPEDMNDLAGPKYQITMDGKSAAQLFREIKADVLAPMHYESWHHFTQFGDELREVFEEAGIISQVRWLKGGVPVSVL
ncbi:hypothetical protein CLAFUW4_14119 [Fulvia fulva]|uniref:Metallo-beta-lactamase domain-containing protein n=1 Tax=Passalora fulva TaxID=5499 RepID=A0A9Q8PL90_PASFU|nr:uncharacterized protein CLAFUR5_13953 [Fulvia fulva]KAK4610626.1 hypothetical protein CLAFUR4_14122 [Fulvia fulva]KAK4610876.1 hypothetical protein CLAFUR0_14126 [Fulvia fulva]UJO24576.1 hypothetical protein CLAFUR5_13953 [Fulvia fulva]WPV21876.1 hypothetical protein CLAFUW4_14119 [Fulvia fulva]WPV36683.1 hypothetical protein CLAFUW7_14130 [Fulvia fulva]